MENIRRYRAASDLYPAEIRQVSGGSEMVLFATPDEVADVQKHIGAVLAPFRERNADPAARPHYRPLAAVPASASAELG
jgi:hypothetical protein